MRILSISFLVAILFQVVAVDLAQAQIDVNIGVRRPHPRPVPPHYRPYPPPGYGRPVPPPPPSYPAPYPAPYPSPTPGYPRQGDVVCEVADRGWEEHRPHYSCGECLSYHGSCVETCNEVTEVATVQGQDYYGRVFTFEGSGRSRWEAEQEARRNCEWNRDIRNCYVVSNRTATRILSRRECR